MHPCDTCGNDYPRSFRVTTHDGKSYTFDSLECAIHKLAPVCETCGQRIIGHGIEHEASKRMFCCAHCWRSRGVGMLSSDAWEGYMSVDGPGRVGNEPKK
jgi:hypothetical protein